MIENSNNIFHLTEKECNYFLPAFVTNIEEIEKAKKDEDRLLLFHLKETRNIIFNEICLLNTDINKINKRLNTAGPKEASIIQKTINDINSIIENEDPNIKITQEFQEMVNYIEKESQDHGGKSLFISSAIQILESYISTNNNFKSLGVGDVKEIDKELSKDIKLLELIQLFYKDYLETNPLQTNDNTGEKRDGKFVVIGKKSKTKNQNGKPRNL